MASPPSAISRPRSHTRCDRQRPRARLIGVLLVAALSAGCSHLTPKVATASAPSTPPTPSTSDASTTKPTANPPLPPPGVGTCRNLSFAELSRFSNPSPAAPCRKPHTSYTFDVVRLPDDIAFTGVQIGNDAVQSAAARACQKSFGRFIGGDPAARALSRITVTYFVPPQSDFDRGAHWVRCDVVALQSAHTLAPLPRSVQGLLNTPNALTKFGVCAVGEPGTPGAQLVMCDRAHAFRAVAALRLGGSDAPYPGEAATRTDGQQRCKDYLAQLLGTSSGYTYSWTYPSPTDWRSGQRFGYCWHQTAS